MAGKFKMIFGGLIRSLHQLWLQVTGTFLLGFALAFGWHAFKEYRKYTVSPNNLLGLVSALAVAVLTLSFGLHSFWKARKLR
jgi:hypothetical protein